ncbi:hypothetical protein JW824_02385 [bacterium]|nr:hypothetical protein [bacterium]RQV93254.1 MAG: hypothetical protein EH221_09780 [bacterium]
MLVHYHLMGQWSILIYQEVICNSSMPYDLKLKLENRESTEVQIIDVSIPDEEWKILKDFKSFAEELLKSKIMREGFQVQFNVSGILDGNFKFNPKLPPDDDLAILLHRMRPFILNNELTNFNRVCNILSRSFENDIFRQVIKRYKEMYSGTDFRNQIRILFNDKVLNSDKFFMEWLNAYEYHRIPQKRDNLEELFNVFPLSCGKSIISIMLIEKARAVREIYYIIVAMDKKNDSPLRIPK